MSTKKLDNKIADLYEKIEMGMLTDAELGMEMKSLYLEIRDNFEEGTDEYYSLMDELKDCRDLREIH